MKGKVFLAVVCGMGIWANSGVALAEEKTYSSDAYAQDSWANDFIQSLNLNRKYYWNSEDKDKNMSVGVGKKCETATIEVPVGAQSAVGVALLSQNNDLFSCLVHAQNYDEARLKFEFFKRNNATFARYTFVKLPKRSECPAAPQSFEINLDEKGAKAFKKAYGNLQTYSFCQPKP